MTEEDIRLKLLYDKPIYIEGIGNFKLPTTEQIVEMNESTYQLYVAWLLISKDQLTNKDDEICNYSDYEIVCAIMQQDNDFRNVILSALETFLDSKPQIFENGMIYFGELKDSSFLTVEKWEYIKKLIRIGNYIENKKEEEYVAGNERARKFMEKLKKKKELLNKTKKEQTNLHSITSAVGWKTGSFFNVQNLTIYQLYDAYYRLGLIENYHYTLTGIYTGNIDSSKIKLPDINWANIIKLN